MAAKETSKFEISQVTPPVKPFKGKAACIAHREKKRIKQRLRPTFIRNVWVTGRSEEKNRLKEIQTPKMKKTIKQTQNNCVLYI